MMKLHYYLIVIILFFVAEACDFYDVRLSVKNNSNHAIAFETSLDTNLEYTNYIPFYIREKILPGETSIESNIGSTNEWSRHIQRSKNKKLNVFIINLDTLTKYNDLEFVKSRKMYKRYEFTEEDLDRKNWIIEYP